jgi:hypothetical protein
MTFETIKEHIARIRELLRESHSSNEEHLMKLDLVLMHLTSAVEALAAHVASQAADGK